MRDEVKFRAAGIVGASFLGALFATVRLRIAGDEHWLRFRRAGEPVIFVFWHAQMRGIL